MRKKLLKVLDRPVAHRGLHDYKNGIIENSISAFDEAIANNYAIECDLQLSLDEVPVVFHDETLNRVTGQPGKIAEMNASDILKIPLSNSKNNDRIQSFEQFLRQIDSRVALAIEIKPQNNKQRNEILAKMAVKCLANYSGPLAFISFAPDLLQGVKKYGFTGPIGIIVSDFNSELAKSHLSPIKRFILRNMLHYPKTKFDFVDVDHKALNLLSVRLFRKLRFPIAAWTVTTQEEADEALKYCDQIAFESFIPRQ